MGPPLLCILAMDLAITITGHALPSSISLPVGHRYFGGNFCCALVLVKKTAAYKLERGLKAVGRPPWDPAPVCVTDPGIRWRLAFPTYQWLGFWWLATLNFRSTPA